ncbi:MAG: excinuclease ABC subunit UvrC [Thermomicrobiales bacterium]|nr:excinuclease ABC subunit UvrC [Thermomicrobiales bacterium]
MTTKNSRPDFSSRLASLATRPGVYLMKDADGNVLYVGKAISLRNRVRSYFQNQRHKDPKTRELVSHITDFEVIRTDTATEALILENNLIKKYLPKYNIMLKDSKTYPYIRITNEEWPRVISTRLVVQDGSQYFGPYTSAGAAYKTINLLNRLFPYRKCDKKITGHDEVCLYFHMHQCTAPCIGAVSHEEYMKAIDATAKFLSGKGDEIVKDIEHEMIAAAEDLNFERAAELRDRLQAVNHVLERQKIVIDTGSSADIIGVSKGEGGDAGVQISFLRHGKMIGSEFFPMQARVEDSESDILQAFVTQFYEDAALVPPRLVMQYAMLPEEAMMIEEWLTAKRGGKVSIHVPQRGNQLGLVRMVAKSAAENLEQARIKHLSDEMKMTAAMTELAEALDLPRMPRRIECFDNSNIQGTSPVASMVVFEDGRPAKKEYRRFSIKTVVGADDFASMKEVIGRRFRRAKEADEETEGKWTTLPDLVIIDGGKGQLSAALEALEEIGMEVPICGLAKEQEEIFLPGRPDSILLPRDSQALFLVQRIRDEAHRFAITYHRNTRRKNAFKSQLDDIPGVGPTRKKALMKHFGSIKAMRAATIDEITAVDGINQSVALALKSAIGDTSQTKEQADVVSES